MSIDFGRYAVTAASIGIASTATADFSGNYTLNPPVNANYSGANAIGTFGNWTSSLTYVPQAGTVTASDSVTTNAPTTLALQLAVGRQADPTDTFNFFTTVQGAGSLSFNWNFTDNGVASGAIAFGYTKNGTFTQLTSGISQSGSTNISVNAGDTFGFRVVANYAGAASVTISNFSAPVPEPAVAGLILTGVVGLVALRELRRRARVALDSPNE